MDIERIVSVVWNRRRAVRQCDITFRYLYCRRNPCL